jgi:sigma-E factor negative regulatory protein RseB
LSLFQQPGRLAPAAVDGAATLRTADGGAVWRWPGSEPRQVVWQGGGHVFTALSDAPTDEILEVVAGLPADPPPSILTRLRRGLDRMGTWLGGGRSAAAP